MKPVNPIILALDYDNLNDVKNIVSEVRPHIGMLKVGLELYAACGQAGLSLTMSYGLPIFLDLKLHDIPRTVEKTVRVLCDKLSAYPGPHFLSVHCFGGKEMCQRAWDAAQGSNVEIVGITLLSSIWKEDLNRFGFYNMDLDMMTTELALGTWHGKTSPQEKADGINHFVCAPDQTKNIRCHFDFPEEVVLITPGIRFRHNVIDDHRQTATVTEALHNGADWLVIGRPITQAVKPELMAMLFQQEVEKYRHGQ